MSKRKAEIICQDFENKIVIKFIFVDFPEYLVRDVNQIIILS